MSDDSTLEKFTQPTPEEKARREAMAEIKEEEGKLKNKLVADISTLKRRKGKEHRPSERVSINEQIAAKQQEFKDLEWAFYNASTETELALQKRVRGLMNWDVIMKKHGVAGY